MQSAPPAAGTDLRSEIDAESAAVWPPRRVALALALLALAVVFLHHRQLVQPAVWQDDFQILSASYRREDVRASFWQSHNEHVMPLGRLSTWLLVQLAGEPPRLPVLAAWQGVLAVLAAMALIYWFVRKELGEPVYGVIAAALFGVSSQYREAVYWFSASFAILALDTLLLGLLAAQRYIRTANVLWLAVCAGAAALAPCWFASGILAGPACALYLVHPQSPRPVLHRLAQAAAPLLGTAAFVLGGLLRNLDHILHLEHWQGKTATQAFNPVVGLISTARSLVDNLLLGSFGVSGVLCPPVVVAVGLLLLAFGLVFWWGLAPARRLLAVGVALILSSYWLIYSARAEWGYERSATWGRYQLLSHLGLVLIVAGGLPRLAGRRWARLEVVAGLFALLLLAQLPRAYVIYEFPQQQAALQFIADVDRHCRAEGIPADQARQALQPLRVEGAPDDFNGWEWLRGSADGAAADPTEVRQRLPQEWLRPIDH